CFKDYILLCVLSGDSTFLHWISNTTTFIAHLKVGYAPLKQHVPTFRLLISKVSRKSTLAFINSGAKESHG
ncbi:hypothetical protein R6Q59_000188, partial [Mikania micrantha]